MEFVLVWRVGASVETKVDMKKYLKAVWMLCRFLFVPQWGRHPKDAGTMEARN